MLFEAIEFAAHAHQGHWRKMSRLPYIYHPMAVARTLLEHGCDEPVVVAALLHDTVEDTAVTLDEIERVFGARVARLVVGASEVDRSPPWEVRKWEMVARLETVGTDVLLIVCADKLDNLRAVEAELAEIGDETWAHFTRPRPYQRWYYHAVLDVLRRRATEAPLVGLVAELTPLIEQVFGPPPPPEAVPASIRALQERNLPPPEDNRASGE